MSNFDSGVKRKGSAGEEGENDAKVEPSGSSGGNPGTAGPGKTEVHSGTPENKEGHINPSAPEDANVTPRSTGEK